MWQSNMGISLIIYDMIWWFYWEEDHLWLSFQSYSIQCLKEGNSSRNQTYTTDLCVQTSGKYIENVGIETRSQHTMGPLHAERI